MKTRKIAAVLVMAIGISCTSAVATFIGNPTEVQAASRDYYCDPDVDKVIGEAKKEAEDHWYGKKESGFSFVVRPESTNGRIQDAKEAEMGYKPSIAYGEYFNVSDPTSPYYCLPDDAFKWIASQPESERDYYYIAWRAAGVQPDEDGFCTKPNSPDGSWLADYNMELHIMKSNEKVSDVANGKIHYIKTDNPNATLPMFAYHFKVAGKKAPEKPVDPEKPVTPEKPVNPEQPTDPETPVDPEEPTTPEEKPETPDEEKPAEKPETPEEEKPAEEAKKEEGNLPKTGGIAAVTLAALGVACTVGGVYMTKNKKRR